MNLLSVEYINGQKTVDIGMHGPPDYLFYKSINQYEIYIADFSFVHNGVRYNIGQYCPSGGWYIFLIGRRKVASDNIKITHCDDDKYMGDIDRYGNAVLEKDEPYGPDDDSVRIADLSILPKKKQVAIKKIIIDTFTEMEELEMLNNERRRVKS